MFLLGMVGRESQKKIDFTFLNSSKGQLDPATALQFISTQIETFQLYLVLFTLIAGVVAFMGYNTMKDAVADKLREDAKKITKEELANEEFKKHLTATIREETQKAMEEAEAYKIKTNPTEGATYTPRTEDVIIDKKLK